MTREEAIEQLYREAFKGEHILDTIRDEIKQLPISNTAMKLVLQVIDKYSTESENKWYM